MQPMIRVLGPLEIGPTNDPARPSRRLDETTVTVLATARGRAAAVGDLIEAAFGEQPPLTATKQIQNAVSRLRAALSGVGAGVSYSAGRYYLDGPVGITDWDQFSLHLEAARAAGRVSDIDRAGEHYRQARILWRQNGIGGADTLHMENLRSHLIAQRISVLVESAELLLATERLDIDVDLVPEVALAARCDPTNEALVSCAMRLLTRAGHRHRAIEQYRLCQRRLDAELGISPHVRLESTYLQIIGASGEDLRRFRADPGVELYGRGA